jgi:hypothetical protein
LKAEVFDDLNGVITRLYGKQYQRLLWNRKLYFFCSRWNFNINHLRHIFSKSCPIPPHHIPFVVSSLYTLCFSPPNTMGSVGDWRFRGWIVGVSNWLVIILAYGSLLMALALNGRRGLVSILGRGRRNAAHSIIIIFKTML